MPPVIEDLVNHFVNLRKCCQVPQELEKMCFATREEERKETRNRDSALCLRNTSVYVHPNCNWLRCHTHIVKEAVLDTETKLKPFQNTMHYAGSRHNHLNTIIKQSFLVVYIPINSTNVRQAPVVCPALCSSLEFKDE